MRGLSRTWWRRAKKANQHEPVSMRFYNVWETISRFAVENQTSDFMAEMTRRRDAHGSEGMMGLLVSHDVNLNAAFPEFVAKTYAHNKKTGRLDARRTSHYEWGRWGYIGFVIKKEKAD